MKNFSISPNEMAKSFWQNRNLVKELVKREVLGRYRGSLMGLLWSFLTPMFMLAVYTFVFSFVFNARWDTGSDSKIEFALVLFAGLMVFNLFSECINRAPSLILSNVNYVKKVVFPLEILPVVALGSALFHLLASLCVWIFFYTVFIGLPHPSSLLLPLVLLPLVMLIIGLSSLLASLGVYLRDVSQLIGTLTTALMFLSPIFYPASALPEKFQRLLLLNPLSPVIEQVRGVLMWGQVPDWRFLSGYILFSMIIAWVGFAWFQRTRKGFADVL
jgi:lipopolysaccharide transport system permease protein